MQSVFLNARLTTSLLHRMRWTSNSTILLTNRWPPRQVIPEYTLMHDFRASNNFNCNQESRRPLDVDFDPFQVRTHDELILKG